MIIGNVYTLEFTVSGCLPEADRYPNPEEIENMGADVKRRNPHPTKY